MAVTTRLELAVTSSFNDIEEHGRHCKSLEAHNRQRYCVSRCVSRKPLSPVPGQASSFRFACPEWIAHRCSVRPWGKMRLFFLRHRRHEFFGAALHVALVERFFYCC